MELSKYIACICEGTAEQVIIDLLIDNNKLIFSRDSLLEHKVLRCRTGEADPPAAELTSSSNLI